MLKTIAVLIAALCALAFRAPGLAEEAAPTPPEAGTYRIEVDIANQITTVLSGADGHIVRQMICSTGRYDGSTPLGEFQLEASRENDRSEWYYIDKYKCFVKYPTRIQGSILFHSLPYDGMDMALIDTEAEAELGSRASHGCIRMRWEDARWIAENCADGTDVRIFQDGQQDDALRAALLESSYMDETDRSVFEPLHIGASGDVVAALQNDLIALGLVKGPASGVYDLETLSAVISFQVSVDQRATGSVDGDLRAQIASAARDQR